MRTGPVLAREITIGQLPQLKSWPDDGGAYITLPQVYTEDPDRPGFARSNLGMYRVQLSGGQYEPDREVGLHYQIQRGIAAHHAAALRRGETLRVNVFVGGPPAMTVAAVMPLPEGMSELAVGRRVGRAARADDLPHGQAADPRRGRFLHHRLCWIPTRLKPEGPFGDHLGYYSLAHDFPVMRVEHVYHRPGAIWPFTVVGRPPQEDTIFGQLIHELVGPVIPKQIPGVRAVHAVDAAGVHPLLLAIGSERYVPYEERRRPRELLTLANALLGHGQLSLAKYLWIAAGEDNPRAGRPRRARVLPPRAGAGRLAARSALSDLHHDRHAGLQRRPAERGVEAGDCGGRSAGADAAGGLRQPAGAARGSWGSGGRGCFCRAYWWWKGPPYSAGPDGPDQAVAQFCGCYNRHDAINGFPLVVVVDHSDFAAKTLENFLWTTFTRSNPATDVYGIEPFYLDKHWGCFGSLVIDARSKPHHAPPLVEDPAVTRRVDALAARGGPLHGIVYEGRRMAEGG